MNKCSLSTKVFINIEILHKTWLGTYNNSWRSNNNKNSGGDRKLIRRAGYQLFCKHILHIISFKEIPLQRSEKPVCIAYMHIYEIKPLFTASKSVWFSHTKTGLRLKFIKHYILFSLFLNRHFPLESDFYLK